MKDTALPVLAAALLATASIAQATNWRQVPIGIRPSPREQHAMAYDSARGEVVLFGGTGLVDTWEYDGVNWKQVTTANTPLLLTQAMVYDSARGKIVCVGHSSLFLHETWEYDGVNWTQVTTTTSPGVRFGHEMAYDSARGKVVMFGGKAYGGAPDYNDTWEYDGVNWTLVTTAINPSGRSRHEMAYDSARGRVVMFGGFAAPTTFGETWEYDGVNWTLVTNAGPAPRRFHAMAYDSTRGKVMMFGGRTPGIPEPWVNDTWEYDGVNWTQVATASSPSVREHHGMAYDSARGKVVMFGGGFYTQPYLLNDTWEYGLSYADASSYGAGCGNPALAFAPTTNPAIGTTASALISNAPTSLIGVAMGWSDTFLIGLPILPVDLGIMGMTGCELLQSNDAFGLPTTLLTASTAQFAFAVPLVPNLIGVHVYTQAYAVAPGMNVLGVIASNGVDWYIGT